MDRALKPLPDEFARTVHALHRVAEELVAPARKRLTSLPAGGRVVAGLVAAELDDAPLELDDAAAGALARWYAFADATLRELGGTPVLWPEHFDIAIDLGDEAAGRRATYGFSP